MRTKEHPAKPMTVDDALYEMELVGHDFFLFHDKQSDKPCVVYRRHAYDYGLIQARLDAFPAWHQPAISTGHLRWTSSDKS